ncbi:MAG: ribose 5-phosphate isomerase B [Candidatus Omnitrophota bacterium]
MKKIIIGSDHAGFELKEELKAYLIHSGFKVEDVGAHSPERCDYPGIASNLAAQVSSGKFRRGILICYTGIGNSIVANRFSRIRAALCYNLKAARLAREHNDSNVLVLGAAFIGKTLAKRITRVWLKTGFVGQRHKRRIKQIEKIGECLREKNN